MKTENVSVLKIKLKGEDADNFKKAIKKLSEKSIGFNSREFSDEEVKVLKTLNNKINPDGKL